jgi:hypothetical protein
MRPVTYVVSLLCVSLLSFTPGGNRKYKTGAEKEGFKGNVKSCYVTQYNVVMDSGRIIKGNNIKSAYYLLFNEKGNKIEEGWIRNGHKTDQTSYTYNDKGEYIESDFSPNNAGEIIVTKYKYDKNGNDIEEDMGDSMGGLKQYTDTIQMIILWHITGKVGVIA